MAAGDPHDLEVRDLTAELVRRLRGFLDGHETHASLMLWARAVWGDSQVGPVDTNRVATAILMNLWNAASRSFRGDEQGSYILRGMDVAEYLRLLQRGSVTAPVREVGGLKAPLRTFAAQLGIEPERHVVEGLGWFEVLQFASPGSGRVFVMNRSLEHVDVETLPTDVVADMGMDAPEVLRDLFETLVIDLADVAWLADGFAAIALPRRTLWRQDDNGNRAAVATFTGVRKAEAALRHYDTSTHKQVYWLEDVRP
jgi:hypothetical protein